MLPCETVPPVNALLLGMEPFEHRPGGANRYFAVLHGSLNASGSAEAVALTLGPPVDDAVATVAVSHPDTPLRRRLWSYGTRADQLAGVADVVDAHFALYTAAALAFKRVRRRPLVVHFQGPWAAESRSVGQRRIAVTAKYTIERFVYRRADRIIVLSRGFGRMLTDRYGVDPWRVRVIPPAIDLDKFSPGDRAEARLRLGLDPGDFVVASARRLVPRMGLDVLVDALAALDSKISPTLVIAGEGPEREMIEAAARRSGVADRLRLLGRIADDDLVAMYRAADVVVLPSRSLEGFGLVVLEALACGTPVIASDVDGLRDALVGLDPSLLVTVGDHATLTERLMAVYLGHKPSPRHCRLYAEQFDRATLAERHLEVYRQAIDPPPRVRRVVYLTHTAQPSGAELALCRLLSALGPSVQPYVIVGEHGPLCELLDERNIPYEVLAMGGSSRFSRADLGRFGVAQLRIAGSTIRGTMRLARRLRALAPDLVHGNSLRSCVIASAAAPLAGVPLVWHLHDRISDDYLPVRAVKVISWLATRAPRGIIANSSAALSTLPHSRGPRRVVGNVVESQLFDSNDGPPSDPEGTLLVGVVGRLAEWKGQHVFLEAFARAFPTGDVRACVIGAPLFGEYEYEARLRRLARDLGVADRVEFRGHRADVQREYASIDIVVHSSVIPEPFGQVIVEAQAVGRPVVAAAAGGVLELVTDGVDGLLYPPGDVDALAQSLDRLVGDPDLRARLARNGRERARRMAPARVAADVRAAYDEVVSGAVR